ncbi:MAG: hypothetical protein A2X49_05220 [Lentisphaerae bacterium GWF2_52_8]|nr:MAG: hypothetical protein A2X49_05220 [Lentisphaerae bacterium GWF2_52_8]
MAAQVPDENSATGGNAVHTENTLPRGSIIGLYEVLSFLSKTGIGDLYLARNTITNKRYALKLLPSILIANDEFTDNFVGKAKIAKQHVHPKIVNIHEAGCDQGFYYIVTEYVEGSRGRPVSLEEILTKKEKLSERQARRIALDICEALEYAHTCPTGAFTHSDLKPSNILFDLNRELRVADFDTVNLIGSSYVRQLIKESLNAAGAKTVAVAPFSVSDRNIGEGSATMSFKLLSSEKSRHLFNFTDFFSRERLRELFGNSSRPSLSMEDTASSKSELSLLQTSDTFDKEKATPKEEHLSLLETYDYMSPEQKAGEIPTPQSNIYSLGLIIYRMLTGSKMAGTWSLPSTKGCRKSWDLIMMKCLSREQEDRYPTIAELREDLNSLDIKRGIPLQKLAPLILVLLVLFVFLFAVKFARLGTNEDADTHRNKQNQDQDAGKLKSESILEEFPVQITITPPGAIYAISKDGLQILKGISKTQEMELLLAPGTYQLEVERQGYETLKCEFKVSGYTPLKFELTELNTTPTRHYVQLDNLKEPKHNFPWKIPATEIEMLPMQPGKFMRGSPNPEAQREEDEEAQREASINYDFWISSCEITQWQYEIISREHPSYFKGAEAQNAPVDNVSYNAAVAFCRKLTEAERSAGRLPQNYVYRLPSEAEWEYCCRAGRASSYSFGQAPENLEIYAWFEGNSGRKPHPVGTRKANAWGLYDMHGNLAEWCLEPVKKKVGGKERIFYVLRGGAWFNTPEALRSSSRRLVDNPQSADYSIGFRIVLAPPL